ncbi:MAG: CoA transferase subunit A [Deltaproteobacteria bacterium]|nr:CoA transferase subunit A [Deltaproteobacteria bacterium]
MEVLFSGTGECRVTDPDELREWMRTQKRRAMEDKVMDAREAVRRYVHDGDYVSYDFSSFTRGPSAMFREIMRQRKRDLWLAAKFTLMESALLLGAGCLRGIDVGFMGLGSTLTRACEEGRLKVTEWTNGSLTLRHLAGAMGVPFIPTRTLLGTDTLRYSGAKVVQDPFTGKKVCLVPSVNPDVAFVHVHQCDIYGNARCFGPGVSPLETAMASKRTIISAEEIVDHEDIRRDPGRTTIPYYAVDAVVHVPYGAHPGGVQGLYELDTEHLTEFLQAERDPGKFEAYLDRYVFSVSSHAEYLEKRVGMERLLALKRRATIREGYR